MWKGVGAVAIDTHLDKPALLSGRCVLPIRELSDRHLGVIFHTYKQVKLIRQQWALQTNGMGWGGGGFFPLRENNFLHIWLAWCSAIFLLL